MNPESMLDILKAAAAESEEASDKIAEDFMDKGITIDEFLEQFKSSRMEMHLRKLKVDKMQELLRHGAGAGPPQPAPYPTGGMSNFYGSPTPYPSMPGYPMMPMPPSFNRPPY
jgi:ESCRT-I complex subunit VPS37